MKYKCSCSIATNFSSWEIKTQTWALAHNRKGFCKMKYKCSCSIATNFSSWEIKTQTWALAHNRKGFWAKANYIDYPTHDLSRQVGMQRAQKS